MDLDFLRQKDFFHDETWKKAFSLALAVWRVSHFAEAPRDKSHFAPPSGAPRDKSHFAETPRDESHFADMSKEMLKRKLRKLASDIISELAAKRVFDGQPEEKSKLIFEAVRKIEALRAHLRLVQNLKLTKEINCQVLDKEYRLLKEKLLKEAIETTVREEPAPFIQKMPVPAERLSENEPKRDCFASLAMTNGTPAMTNGTPAMTNGTPAMTNGKFLGSLNANSNGRLEKIVNYIRENKVIRLKEVLKFFPEYSEKTIRNDLKQLCGRNFIERLGNGAGSCYKLVV